MSESKPSTSAPSKFELNLLPRGAISIKGTPVGRNVRLPSIKGPRDLTLGTSVKRTFTPNIPVRREKRTSESSSEKSSSDQKESVSNIRGRGRARGKKTFVQTPGAVFGEGVTNQPKSFGFRSSEGKRDAVPPKLMPKSNIVIKKEKIEDEAELSDNFIDDDDASDDDEGMLPIPLPLKENYYQSKVPIKESKESMKKEMKKEKLSAFVKRETTVLEILERLTLNSDSTENEDLFFVELPDYFCIPKQDGQSGDSSSSDQQSPASSTTHWSNANDGCIGKLQFLKSGKSRLIVGSHIFETMCTEPNPFLQELLSVQSCDNVTEMTVIGQVKHKVKFLPEVENLLESVLEGSNVVNEATR